MEGGRRFRRFGIRRGKSLGPPPTVLPLHDPSHSSVSARTRLSYTLSCWYCDLQLFGFTDHISRFGRRNARYLRVWFSIGVGFGATLMLVLAMFLLWELARFLYLHESNVELSKLVFGFSPTVSDLRISLADTGFILLSTLISVSTHEIGHIIAAASEGVQVEYIAVFVAVVFPGALVAFDQESLQALQRISALRIYCAGVWHNAVCCAVCGLALLLLPSMLFPLYIHGQGPVVLEVPHSSPLHGYLSPCDIVVALDGIPIHDLRKWAEVTALLETESYQESNHSKDTRYVERGSSRKGYCVPRVLLEESVRVGHADDVPTCPNDLTGFASTPCSYMDITSHDTLGGDSARTEERTSCLNANAVIKLKKCGDGWSHIVNNGSSCICSQDESCFTPIKIQDSVWVEVTYLSPHRSLECSQIEQRLLSDAWTSVLTERNCTESFVYVGDLSSMSNSVRLTSYRPRFWASSVGAYVPDVLEKILALTYHVSLTLALLNTLPVFFLDGESILEVKLSYCSWLSHRTRKLLRLFILAAGTLISGLSFVRLVAKGF